MPKLSIELVPSTAWGKNVRSEVTPAEWDRIRRAVYAEFFHRCAICKHEDRQLHCHEVWGYDDEKHIQRLVYLVALCNRCHAVKHFGYSSSQGQRRVLLRHLARQNKWTVIHAEEYANEQFYKCEERSRHDWALDLSALRRYL